MLDFIGEGLFLRGIGGRRRGGPEAAIRAEFAGGVPGDAWISTREWCYTRSAGGAYEKVTTSGDLVARRVGMVNGVYADQLSDSFRPKYMEGGGKSWLSYDGLDDFLATHAIDFTVTNKITLFAGVRKSVDAIGCIAELSASTGANAGAFNLLGDSSDGYRYSLSGSGGTTSQYKSSGLAAPRSDVISAQFDIAGATIADEIKPLENGITPTLTVNVAGPCATTNFGSYSLYTGRRGGATLPFTGRDYGVIAIGKSLSAAKIISFSAYIEQLTD